MDSRWYLAQTLDERLKLSRETSAVGSASNSELARKRLDRWKTGIAFSDDTIFQRFLLSIGLNESEFAELLGQSPEQIEETTGSPMQWAEEVLECLKSAPTSSAQSPSSDFLALVDPLIFYFRNNLQTHADMVRSKFSTQPHDTDTLVRLLSAGIAKRARQATQKILILETNIARVENRLQGETAAERYDSFIKLISTNEGRLPIYLEYPVLIRRVWQMIEQWFTVSCELIERLYRDYGALDARFGLDGAAVVGIALSGGDMHCQGRSVHLIEFSNKKKIVYKPRSLAVDCLFSELLKFLSERGLKPDLKVPQTLNCGTYGWCEHIEYKECETETQVKTFYERQGAWLALLYFLGTTDVHLENLIAHGEHPVVIDLETVFHPKVKERKLENADDLAAIKLFDSVMSVDLLPMPVHAGGRSMDTSGIGAKPDQIIPIDWDYIENQQTDEIHISKIPGRFGDVLCSPRLRGAVLDAVEYHEQIKTGFSSTYRLLLNLREELWGKEGYIEQFSRLPIRVILRPTAVYASLREASLHPHYNHRGLDLDWVFKDLWALTKENVSFEKTTASEIRQLHDGDIPYFSTTPDSKDITGGDGVVITSMLDASGREIAERRLQRMGDVDLNFQLWLIDAALQSISSTNTPILQTKGYPRKCDDFLAGAIACGDRLVELAVTHLKQTSWISLSFDGDDDRGADCYELRVLGQDLYRGSLGIAFFLGYLHASTGNERYREIAENCLNQSADHYAALVSPGAYAGLTGLVYVNMHLAKLFGWPDLRDRTDFTLGLLPSLIESDSMLDLMYGCAGAIPVLLAYSSCFPESQALALARACGDKLLEQASPGSVAGGMIWKSLQKPRGFSHGLSGIAFALSELAAVTNEKKYFSGFEAALAEEAELLKDDRWTDSPDNPQGVAWCHGAAGIALSRMKIYQRHGLPAVRDEAVRALQFLLASPTLAQDVLCHGAMGNLEPLVVASEVFSQDPIWQNELQLRSKQVLANINRNGWKSKVASHVIEPGLMTGLAGIGFEFLRLHAKEKVPSVLMLDHYS